MRKLTFQEALNYEIFSHSWAKYVSHPLLQDKLAWYFTWKTRRKYERYVVQKEFENKVLNLKD